MVNLDNRVNKVGEPQSVGFFKPRTLFLLNNRYGINDSLLFVTFTVNNDVSLKKLLLLPYSFCINTLQNINYLKTPLVINFIQVNKDPEVNRVLQV